MRHNRDTVARLAGVSSATVSRVYNHPDKVDAATALKVRKAAAEIGYVPDLNASTLRRSGSGVILFCQRRMESRLADRYYKWLYADVILAVSSRIDETSYRLRLQQYDKVEELESIVMNKQADAIIAYGVSDVETAAAFSRLGLPYVCCHHLHGVPAELNVVSVDEFQGGAIAGKALFDAGLRRPAHITGYLESMNVCRLRWEGFKSVFTNFEPVLINHGLGITAGREAALQLLPMLCRGDVDDLFVVNDLTALGVVQALLEN